VAPHKDRDEHQRLAGALNHELRRRIMRLMSDGRKASPRDIADELEEKLSNVAYHVRILVDARALRPAGTKQVRGAQQHFYRWSLKPKWARDMLEEPEKKKPAAKKNPKKRKKRKKRE